MVTRISSTLFGSLKTSETIGFGVGCMQFAPVYDSYPSEFTGSQYLDDLGRALRSLPGVRDVTIDESGDVAALKATFLEDLPPLGTSGRTFPTAPFFAVSLQIDIGPDDLFEGESWQMSEIGPYFVVYLAGYYKPVVFVIAGFETSSPSTGVMLIREKLRRELDKSPYPIALDVMGPSPFHADFTLLIDMGDKDEQSSMRAYVTRQAGYDHIKIAVPAMKANTPDSLEEILLILKDQFSEYYELVASANDRNDGWSEVTSAVNAVGALQEGTGVADRWYRARHLRRAVGAAFSEVVLFEHRALALESSGKTLFQRSVSGVEAPVAVEHAAKEELERLQAPLPIGRVFEFLRFVEERRARVVGHQTAVVAALLGAAVGALITALVR